MSENILDAITVVLMNAGELLMVHRQQKLRSFAGYWAFPGGKVDAADHALPPAAITLPGLASGLIHALLREAREEIDLDLLALHTQGLLGQPHLLGEATTPPMANNTRFRTHFVRVDLATRPVLTPDLGEITSAEWATPEQWLARYQAGRLLLAPPTRDLLQALVADPQVQHIPNFDDDHLPEGAGGMRSIEPLAGLHQLLVRSNTLPPATHTNAWIFGDSHRVVVDPSPADRHEYERLLGSLNRFGVDEVLLTHHHPDHRQFANELAAHFGVPLAMSDDTRKRISRKSPEWLGDLTVRIYEQGDVVTRWLGEPVRIYPVPGHDEGQLGLMPDSRSWFLVGDLIQGIGTVVIAKPEGHMGRYMESLRKVIALEPAVILPSHGQATGGTQRLEAVLKHRIWREEAILAMYQQNQSVAQMLPLLYADIDPRLMPLAAMNIESHLDKLREEGRIAA
jgi:glyoxylase-like metal-dependent hydrolase (beta-lactamase superfamily II)/8-oxo-dGTP pyrophosphatase MutT (NUDIX family)